jgi:hypothetical protein
VTDTAAALDFDLDGLAFTSTIEGGTYDAVLVGLEKGEKRKYQSDEMEPAIIWHFSLILADDSEYPMTARTSLAMGAKSKTRAYAKSLIRREPEPGETLGSLKLVGRMCMVAVEITDEGYANIAAVLPAKVSKSK